MPATATPDELTADLNPAQLEAVLATTGPVAILAGAGTGKTRVISRRAAYAIRTGVVAPADVLVVTFTEKAAGEMAARLAGLGHRGVTARTFHAHALSQLRHFWPSRHDGDDLPELLDSKLPLIVPLARALPGHYRFTVAKDLAGEIEWAKARRIAPRDYERSLGPREPPLPPDLMGRVYRDYERVKTRSRRLDFEDLLLLTVELLETDEAAAETVRARKRWFSVDEYQDTNPLQQQLLELWLGDRDDVCVVGDEDQTIYTFTGATSRYLLEFERRHPGARVVSLVENYRSSPQVLELANRLIAWTGRSKALVATRPDGPEPRIVRHPAEEAELATLVARIRALVADGVAPGEIAVLVRTNAQLAPLEEALTRAGIAYQVRGVRFFDRPDVRGALDLVRRGKLEATGPALRARVAEAWADRLGYEEGSTPEGAEARERTAALDTLLAIFDSTAEAAVDGGLGLDAGAWLAELDRRAAHDRTASGDGVNLLTYHRAKGLEWDAVFLPMLEEGSLPIRQAFDDDEAVAEERRLLYVGITRARRHLELSWAELRETRGRESRRRPSRFLEALKPPRTPRERRVVELPPAWAATADLERGGGAGPARRRRSAADGDSGDPVFEALRAWRAERAKADAVPAYVVAHDSTLAAIVEARPDSLAALRRVPGMGPTKLERYGPDILAVLGRFAGGDA